MPIPKIVRILKGLPRPCAGRRAPWRDSARIPSLPSNEARAARSNQDPGAAEGKERTRNPQWRERARSEDMPSSVFGTKTFQFIPKSVEIDHKPLTARHMGDHSTGGTERALVSPVFQLEDLE